VVLDTNITVSGLLWRGAPRQVIAAARDARIELWSSVELLDELEEVLQRLKFAARLAQIGKTPAELVDAYLALAVIIATTPLADPVSADPDDDAVRACALAAQAEAIISGDDDVLTLHMFQTIPILTASAFLARLAAPA
jgi:putative PIN family toxin of toxin-antitoxin system